MQRCNSKSSLLSILYPSLRNQFINAWKHLLKSHFYSATWSVGCGLALALLGVVLSAWPRPQLLRGRRDEKKTWVTFGHLLVVVHVSPLSLPHWLPSVVRVRRLMLRPGRLVPEAASWAVMVPGWAVTSASSSRVASSVSSSVCGADTRHVGPLRHHLQVRGNPLLYCLGFIIVFLETVMCTTEQKRSKTTTFLCTGRYRKANYWLNKMKSESVNYSLLY